MVKKLSKQRISTIAAITIGLILIAIASGCLGNSNSSNTENGLPLVDKITSGVKGTADIQDIIDNPSKYIGKTVTVVGKPYDGIDLRTVYSVSKPDNIRRDGYLAVETSNYPKEELLCVKEISVTGIVGTRPTPSGSEPVIKESSHQVISIDKRLC